MVHHPYKYAELLKRKIERYGAQTHANPDRSVHEFAAASLPMLREQLAKAEALR